MTLDEFCHIHYQLKIKDGQRLGQRFVNCFIKGPFPLLFYERNETEARDVIGRWLADHQYPEHLLPMPLPHMVHLLGQNVDPA